MGDKQTKRPAHEVIMEEIKIVLGELENGLNPAGFSARLTTLFDVLGKMVIPDKRREEIVKELVSLQARYAALWKGNNVWITPASFPKLIRRLSDEHETGKETE